MLLSSLSILMGAILVPSDYLWVYSTHIILMCLYLIWSKRLIVLFLTLLSFLFVILSEFSSNYVLPFQVGDRLWVDFENQRLSYTKNHVSGDFEEFNQSISIAYFDRFGERQVKSDFSLVAHIDIANQEVLKFSTYSAEITGLVLPDKNGAWWQKQLYIKKQAAQIYLQFSQEDLIHIDKMAFSKREKIIARLDTLFEEFDSWRISRALLLGQNDLWSERDTWIIRTLGLAHLFVVSGLHTGFMFVIGCLISRSIWRLLPNQLILTGLTRWQCDVLVVIPLLIFYAYLTGWGEPVVRASIMLSVYMFARMLAIKVTGYSIISFALWLVLLVNPRAILSPGLWLSFSMVYLLIGFCQTSTKLPRLIMVQVMLSTASMVLILGWQEAISSISILVNIILIPFAAFIWFPAAMLSCLEAIVNGSVYSYILLDKALAYVMTLLEWAVFQLPLMLFEQFSSNIPRIIMLLLIGYWVYQSPLKRGVVSAIAIWCVLFATHWVGGSKADLTLANKDNQLAVFDRNNMMLIEARGGSDMHRLLFSSHLNLGNEHGYMLSPSDIKDLTPRLLLDYDIKWVVLRHEGPEQTLIMLEALAINWLVVPSGESLEFYIRNQTILLRHSSCLYSFFLLKSDTCKRVEKLESMLNYLQT